MIYKKEDKNTGCYPKVEFNEWLLIHWSSPAWWVGVIQLILSKALFSVLLLVYWFYPYSWMIILLVGLLKILRMLPYQESVSLFTSTPVPCNVILFHTLLDPQNHNSNSPASNSESTIHIYSKICNFTLDGWWPLLRRVFWFLLFKNLLFNIYLF